MRQLASRQAAAPMTRAFANGSFRPPDAFSEIECRQNVYDVARGVALIGAGHIFDGSWRRRHPAYGAKVVHSGYDLRRDVDGVAFKAHFQAAISHYAGEILEDRLLLDFLATPPICL